jgi:sugar phosphate isomerase/epimerase
MGRQIEVARMLGASSIRISIQTEEDIPWVQQAADQAIEQDIRLVHQTHTNSLFESIDGCLEMVARVDRSNFGVIVEPANLLLCGEDYGPESLQRLAPYIFNVYVQNLRLDSAGAHSIRTRRGIVRYERLQIEEEGGVDFARFFQGLKSIGYEGFVSSHQPAVEGKSVRQLAQSVFDCLTGFLAPETAQQD